MTTKEEFELRLTEDKFFDNPGEFMEYRLPVIEYSINTFGDKFGINNYIKGLSSKDLAKHENSDLFRMVNIMFEQLKLIYSQTK